MYLHHDTHLPRVTIFGERGRFVIDFEIVDNHPFIHILPETKWTPSLWREVQEASDNFKNFFSAVGYPILYTALTPEQRSLKKMVLKLGWEPIIEFDGNEVFQLKIKEPEHTKEEN